MLLIIQFLDDNYETGIEDCSNCIEVDGGKPAKGRGRPISRQWQGMELDFRNSSDVNKRLYKWDEGVVIDIYESEEFYCKCKERNLFNLY